MKRAAELETKLKEANDKLEAVKKDVISWQEAHRKNGFNPPEHLNDILEFLNPPEKK